MSRNVMIGIAAAVLLLLGILGGYRLGAGSWPLARRAEPTRSVSVQEGTAARKVLYWKDPDGKADFAPAPKKTADGRDYLPVYDEEEPPLAGAQSQKAKGKILYYRNPMGLSDTSPVPKKDWMGMDYIPVYEGEEQDNGKTVRVSLDKVQRSGVRTEAVEKRVIVHPVRAVGTVTHDETRLTIVTMRSEGYIEDLFVNKTGQHVHAGEPLFRVYSPDIQRAQIDLMVAMRSVQRGVAGNEAQQNLEGAMQRLRNLGVP